MKSIVHECMFIRLSSKCDRFGIVPREQVMKMLGEVYHIPKQLRSRVLEELEDSGLIKKDKFKVQVVKAI